MVKEPAMRPTGEPVEEVLSRITSDSRRADASVLCELLGDVSGETPEVWASRIIGFGSYHYRYESGREGDAPLIGFAAQARQFVVYLTADFQEGDGAQLGRLGAHKVGRGCLYLNRLDDVDLDVLRALCEQTVHVHRGADESP